MTFKRLLILDGYVDEPSVLGVPPYLSPYSRYIYGAASSAFEEIGVNGTIDYLTITQYRYQMRHKASGWKNEEASPGSSLKSSHLSSSESSPGSSPLSSLFSGYDIVFLVNNTPVPGNYLGGRPASARELEEIADIACLAGIMVISWKRDLRNARSLKKDGDAFLFDLLSEREPEDRYRTMEEWDNWSVRGAELVSKHPDFPDRLMLEIDTLKGCVRYINGGCSFCTEPLERFRMRSVDSVLAEVGAIVREGGRNIRLAGSCIFSFQAKGIGETDRPTPDPVQLTRLFMGIHELLPEDGIFHVDNGNAGIIASHPWEAEEILKAMVRYTTSGNSLSIGMESADPAVIGRNHLNAEPGEVRTAVRLINRIGKERGENGMPRLLPGINILCGLPDETEATYRFNLEFLKEMRAEGLLFRRINIRQLSPVRIKGQNRRPEFGKWKEQVREEIDVPNLKDIIPTSTLLKNVHMESHDGAISFGRQTGTYPILVGIPFPVDTGKTVDVKITDHGKRSVTGIPFPFDIDHASLKELASLPGIGRKRAVRLKRSQPFESFNKIVTCLGDRKVAEGILGFIEFAKKKEL